MGVLRLNVVFSAFCQNCALSPDFKHQSHQDLTAASRDEGSVVAAPLRLGVPGRWLKQQGSVLRWRLKCRVCVCVCVQMCHITKCHWGPLTLVFAWLRRAVRL